MLEGTTLACAGRIIETIGTTTSDWEGFGGGVINHTALVGLLFVKEATEKGRLSRDA